MISNEALVKAIPVLRSLEQQGYEAVFVGGCVRDTVMGRELKDVDIATSAAPEQVIQTFPKTIPTGLKHGTVTVIHESETYEITTYRTESAYEAYRRPSQVQFVAELESDLMRRDFTINAMAMRADGTIVDPFGGMHDLKNRVLRCVGDADSRFQEDALRMVRAVRFAAEFEMRIALQTWKALRKYSSLLGHIAMERVGAEADKMIGGLNPTRAMTWLAASGLAAHTKQPLPETLVLQAEQFRIERIVIKNELKAMEPLKNLEDRWAAFCIALRLSSEESFGLFEAFRFSGARMGQLKASMNVNEDMYSFTAASRLDGSTSLLHVSPDSDRELKLHHAWMRTILENGKAAAVCWLQAMMIILNNTLDKDKLENWLHEMTVSSVRELAIGGADVLRLLKKPSGPWLGQLLNELVSAVAYGELPNDRDSLLTEVSRRAREVDA